MPAQTGFAAPCIVVMAGLMENMCVMYHFAIHAEIELKFDAFGGAGIKVVVAGGPADAKGLLLAAIQDPDPVVFFEPKMM